MALAVRSMWDPFSTVVRQLDVDFDTLARRAFGASSGGRSGFVPPADVVRDGDDVLVVLELPGVDISRDVDVEVADGRLVISGRRGEERSREESGVLVREIRSGAFRREFALPEGITPDDVEADYDRGLLTIRIRQVAKQPPAPAKIQVRSSGETQRAVVDGGTE